MNRSFLSLSTIVLLFIGLVLLNGAGRGIFRNAQLDLTEEGLYSLSDGTTKVLESLKQPLTAKLYFSRTESAKYPALQLYGSRITDLLKQYERAGRGKLRVEIYDVRPDSEEEEWAQKFGVTPIPTQGGETVFLGLAVLNSRGEERTIPLFDFQRQNYLEYDISRALVLAEREQRPTVGILSALDIEGKQGSPDAPEGAPWFFLSQLQEEYDVKVMDLSTKEIPQGVDLLALIHPKGLSQQTLYAIDQYVMRGGKLLAFVDPYAQADSPKTDPQNPMGGIMADRSSSLNTLTTPWGVELEEKQVVADLNLSAPVSSGRGEEPKNYVTWLVTQRDRGSFNGRDIVSSGLNTMVFPWAGSLKITPKEGILAEPLVQSTAVSMLVKEADYRFNGGDPDALLRQFLPDNNQKNLVVRVSGKLPSSFGATRPAGVEAKGEHLAASQGTANVLIVGDVDLLSDRYSVTVQNFFGSRLAQLLNDNQNFFQNALENLSGSEALISIRSRGGFGRPFEVVQDLESRAQQRWQFEEQRLQAELRGATQRLQQLQGTVEGGEKKVLDQALMDEIKRFRAQKIEAQKQLRLVRRNLRQEIEALGTRLFLLNTFGVPLILIFLVYPIARRRKVTS